MSPRLPSMPRPVAGVDYLHPDLGGGFGPGYRVITGTDYVGDAGTKCCLVHTWLWS